MAEKDCTTCACMNEKGACRKGQQAEIYCMGGDFELWEDVNLPAVIDHPENAEVVQEPGVDIQKIAREKMGIGGNEENHALFSEDVSDGMFSQDLDDIVGGIEFMVNATVDTIQNDIGRELSEEEKKEFFDTQATAIKYKQLLDSGQVTEDQLRESILKQKDIIAEIENRPKTEEEGFNGTKKSSDVKAYSCGACAHHSIVGCFLGRYYDCVDNGRYLFEDAENPGSVPSIEKMQEDKEDEKAAEYIDNLLNEKEEEGK